MFREQAGARADAKYDELARGWRRRKRGLFVGVGVFCFAVLTLSFVGWVLWPGAGYLFGVAGGAVMGLWIAFYDSPPAWIEQWQVGAWAEQKTAKRLKPIEADGWIVLHDLARGRGNVDHVVIGPGGVFVLDTKRTDGLVDVNGDEVTVTRHDDPDLHYSHTGARHVVRLATETHAQLLATRRIRQWVTPVIVWWADFPQRVSEGRCAHVHGDELADWLRRQPSRIAPTRVPQIADAVRAAWASDPVVPVTTSNRLRSA